MIMYCMRQFMQSELVLFWLLVAGAAQSPVPYISMMLAGVLMILYTINSFEENTFCQTLFLQFMVSVAFCFSMADVLSYLVFYAMGNFSEKESFVSGSRLTNRQRIKILYPAFMYVVISVTSGRIQPPLIVVNTLLLLGISMLLYLIEFLTGRYLDVQHQMTRALSAVAVNEMVEKKLNQELMVKNYLREQNARMEERENISRNIHNSVGHSITAAIMTLDAADMLYDAAPEKARLKMNAANERIRETLSIIRQAVRILDTDNEILTLEELRGTLSAVVDQFSMDTMIRIFTDWDAVDGTLFVSKVHTEFLTGALQELLTNGVKHGQADCFTVTLNADSGHVRMKVTDNGKSDFSEDNRYERIQKGYGIRKLESYIQKCGGTISVANKQGFHVSITLPLNQEGQNEPV